ncbi:hypothetical protein Hamer_G020676 [Homarus americanus]|uniref:Uncharacterized protein n=1 Tax=Homarus americanus TaxID=6706 RepID=A0A8J5JH10_HOMAM|nr:hypothetical protein Hamer_G020676 [Homarus americanus]
MTSSPVVCLLGETEARHFTPLNQSFPHSYTSQSVLPSLLHITARPSLTPTPHTLQVLPSPLHNTASSFSLYTMCPFSLPTLSLKSFPHSYTTLQVLLSLQHNTTSPFLTYTQHYKSFPHSYTTLQVLPLLLHHTTSPSLCPTPYYKSFPLSYTTLQVLPSVLHHTTSPSLIPTQPCKSFSHSFTTLRVKGLRINAKPDNGLGEKVGLISVGGRLVLVPNLKLLQPNHVEMDFYPSEAVKIIQYN